MVKKKIFLWKQCIFFLNKSLFESRIKNSMYATIIFWNFSYFVNAALIWILYVPNKNSYLSEQQQ